MPWGDGYNRVCKQRTGNVAGWGTCRKPVPRNEGVFMSDFRSSKEASLRRFLRSAVRQSSMTLSQKEVATPLLNLWLQHRNGRKGIIHPGRERLAKTAQVSVRTVAITLRILRDAGVLKVHARPHGEGQRPTEYTMDLVALIAFCGAAIPKWIEGELTKIENEKPPTENEKRTLRSRKLHTTGVQKMHTAITTASIVKNGLKCDGVLVHG